MKWPMRKSLIKRKDRKDRQKDPEKFLGSIHTELLALALVMTKPWVEYPFLAMPVKDIAKSSV